MLEDGELEQLAGVGARDAIRFGRCREGRGQAGVGAATPVGADHVGRQLGDDRPVIVEHQVNFRAARVREPVAEPGPWQLAHRHISGEIPYPALADDMSGAVGNVGLDRGCIEQDVGGGARTGGAGRRFESQA